MMNSQWQMSQLRLFSQPKPGQKIADTPSCQCTPSNVSRLETTSRVELTARAATDPLNKSQKQYMRQ